MPKLTKSSVSSTRKHYPLAILPISIKLSNTLPLIIGIIVTFINLFIKI